VKNAMQLNVIQRRFKAHDDYLDLWVAKNNDLQHYLQNFRTKRNEWVKFELPVEEMLRQLTEKIEVDLEELKAQISSVVEIDKQLEKVEEFQD